MKCYSLTLGARRVARGRARFAARDEATVHRVTFRHFPQGFTILEARGGWFDPRRRKFVREESRQVVVCTDRAARIRAWGRELGAALRQESLLVVEIGRGQLIRIPGHD